MEYDEFDYIEHDGDFTEEYEIDVSGDEPEDFEKWADDLADFLEENMDLYVDFIETGFDIESPSG